MMRTLVCFVLVGSLVLGAVVPFAESSMENEALAAARQWLSLVDGQDYAQSWREASTYFRQAIGSAQWEQAVRSVRHPLGRVLSRRVLSKTYASSLPGAPDGDYVVIQFASSFEHKQSAIETVTPMKDKDGQWRVSGYYIK